MPKSGQAWNVEFLSSALLTPFEPFLAAWRERSSWPTLGDYSELVEQERCRRAPEVNSVRFAPAEPKRSRVRRATALEAGRLYDGRIALRGEVPCLDQSYHDLFNALVWAAFPRAKRALHARQFRALQQWLVPGVSSLPNRRSREQDALTVFDEGGSVLVTSDPDWAQGEARRPLCAHAGQTFILFGHALMEHIAYGRSAVRSASLVVVSPGGVPTGRALFDLIDREVESRLQSPTEFSAPGVDAVVEIDERGQLWLGH